MELFDSFFLLDIIVSFLCAGLAGLGVGGGGLLVIFLTMIRNTSQTEAQGINLVFFVVGMIPAFILHLKRKRIYKKILPIALPFCISGGVLGSYIASLLKTETLKSIFAWFLIISGIFSLFKMWLERKRKP